MPSVTPRFRGFGVAVGGKALLHGVDWRPGRGFHHVLGPPGAGKTLLARVLARHHVGDSVQFWGRITYDDVDWRVCAPAALVDPRLSLPSADVATNFLAAVPPERLIALLETTSGRLTDGRAWARDWLQAHDPGGLSPTAPARSLDSAARRRLALLRVHMASPPLAFVDDADTLFGAGDRVEAGERTLLEKLAAERPVLLAARSTRLLAELGGECLLLEGGTTRECGEAGAFVAASAAERRGQTSMTERHDRTPSKGPPFDVAPPAGFHWVLPGCLAGMSRPGLASDLGEHLATLRRLGVGVVVTLEEAPVNADALRGAGLEQIHFPIVDMAAPALEPTRRLCEGLWSRLQRGAVVAVHCKAGLGRTGTVLAACLMVGRHSAPQALELLRQVHPQFVQSDAQLAFVREFGAHVGPRRRGAA